MSAPKSSPIIGRQPRDPFETLRGQSPLLRNSEGRLLIPDRSLFDPCRGMVELSDGDLSAIYAEILRIRGIWRARFYIKSTVVFLFLVWTFWFMPQAASHKWPFH